VTSNALSWLSAAVRARAALRRSSSSNRNSARRPPAPWNAQTFAGEQPATRNCGVDQIALAATSIATPGTLAPPNGDASKLQKTSQPGAVAAAALNRERRHTKLARPAEQITVTNLRRCNRPTTEFDAERTERNRDTQILVRVDTDRDPSTPSPT
jgi:hypothetical protein